MKSLIIENVLISKTLGVYSLMDIPCMVTIGNWTNNSVIIGLEAIYRLSIEKDKRIDHSSPGLLRCIEFTQHFDLWNAANRFSLSCHRRSRYFALASWAHPFWASINSVSDFLNNQWIMLEARFGSKIGIKLHRTLSQCPQWFQQYSTLSTTDKQIQRFFSLRNKIDSMFFVTSCPLFENWAPSRPYHALLMNWIKNFLAKKLTSKFQCFRAVSRLWQTIRKHPLEELLLIPEISISFPGPILRTNGVLSSSRGLINCHFLKFKKSECFWKIS